jgi:two-component sensor histidine kinase
MLSALARLALRKLDAPVAWALALGLLLAAWWLRAAIGPILDGFPFITFFPAVVLAAALCGLWPATVVSVLAGLIAWHQFLRPFGSFELEWPQGPIAMAFYVAIVALDIALIEGMRAALRRLAAEQERSAVLARQQEDLYRELQHRVANNMQVVASLLALQARRVQSPQDARDALEDATERLRMLARLHRRLHDPAEAGRPAGSVLRELVHDLVAAANRSDIAVVEEGEPVVLSADVLATVALVAVEAATNTLKHGLAGRPGTITIALVRERAGGITLTVRDDGVGFPDGFDVGASAGLGLRVVHALAAKLHAKLAAETESGAALRLHLPDTASG